MSIAENIHDVQQRIAAAARSAGRPADSVALMAVTKTWGPEAIMAAYDAGLRLFGENRVQAFAAKIDAVRHLSGAEWHMIGHLQSNKASKAAELFSGVDSVDSLHLAEKLNGAGARLNRRLPVLIEVNLGGESAKTGVAPGSPELGSMLQAGSRLPHLEIRGLMTIPPFTEDPQQARPYFRRLRELRDEIAARQLSGVGMQVLSIGMSHDFEVAIEEGSTCVRVGTAIFGERSKP